VAIHDFGCVAKIREIDGKKVRGFQIYVGGGLGATSVLRAIVEDFTPADLLIPTAEAVVRIFDRYGNRKTRPGTVKLSKEWGIVFAVPNNGRRCGPLLPRSGSASRPA